MKKTDLTLLRSGYKILNEKGIQVIFCLFLFLLSSVIPVMSQDSFPDFSELPYPAPDRDGLWYRSRLESLVLDLPYTKHYLVQDSLAQYLVSQISSFSQVIDTTSISTIADALQETGESDPNAPIFLKGNVRNTSTGEILDRIVVEVFMLDENGEMQRAYSGNAFTGELHLPLLKGSPHLVLLRRSGFQPRPVFIEGTEKDLERIFYLDQRQNEADFANLLVARGVPEIEITVPDTIVIGDEETALDSLIALMEPVRTEEKKTEVEEKAEILTPVGIYTVQQATSLRQGPSHKTGVILRFAPGDEVEVLEKTEYHWWKVRVGNVVGYAKALLLVEEEKAD